MGRKHSAWSTYRATAPGSTIPPLTSEVDSAATLQSNRQTLPLPLRQEVWKRGKGRCHYCQVTISFRRFHVDHKAPRYGGGTDDLSNLLAACAKCNVAKGVRVYEDFVRLLQTRGLEWRDTEYRLQAASFESKQQPVERVRGRSNPLIGQHYKVKRLQARAREK